MCGAVSVAHRHAIAHSLNALGALGNGENLGCDRVVGDSPGQPHNAVTIGGEVNPGKSGQLRLGEIRLDFRRDRRTS